jgi:selenocysteine-specific elongation factor
VSDASRVVSTAGHVDHGKSSLVLALTGTDPDRFAEEKQRGLTIDLGFAHTTLPSGATISFIDVPGHVRFLRNMLAGVGGIDACVFIVAATEGWKPQSEEHLRILQLLGLTDGVIALTKVDLVDDEWRDLQVLDITDRVAGTFLADAPIVPVSTTTGTGLDELREQLDALIERTSAAADGNRPRLWIDRVFAAKGSGTVVTGTLTGGSLHTDQRVDVLPAGRSGRIRSIQQHGVTVDRLQPGSRAALNLSGIDHHPIQRGDAVITATQWRPTRRFDATLDVLASLDHDVSRRGAYQAYIGSGEWPVKVRILGPDTIAPGDGGLVRLHLERELPLVPGDRYVLRESGRNETVGGGSVLDVQPMLPASKARPDRSIDRVVAERGWIDVDDLAALTGDHIPATIDRWVVSTAALEAAVVAVRARVADAGALGVDLAAFDDHQRAVLATMDDVEVVSGHARAAAVRDELTDHPVLQLLRVGGTSPPEPTGADQATLRQLVRRGLLFERDGLYFHVDAIDAAAHTVATLLDASPAGFTMSQLREALGVSRKFAVPLATELDARGITRRRGDLRIAGPRLSGGAATAPA